MHASLLELLACPQCGSELELGEAREARGEIETGRLTCRGARHEYPIVRFVPRFVPAENYAANFGFQWLRFSRTQLDSHSGTTITRDRFFAQSGWSAAEMKDRRVLDVGCGAGRFAEIAVSTGARLVAVDYSSAVDACFANLGPAPNLDVVQASVYELPFRREQFDFVYCFGVLQHTPDVKASFVSLAPQVRPGGRLAVDVYQGGLLARLRQPRYWLRPITTRMEPQRLFAALERWVPALLAVSRALGRVPGIGRYLRRLVPVANYEGVFPLNETQIREWALLDTFDWLAPRYDAPQTKATLTGWFREVGFERVDTVRPAALAARGVKPD